MLKTNRTGRRRLISVAEGADYLGISERTMQRRIAEGVFTRYPTGGRAIRVDLNEIEAALDVAEGYHARGRA